MLIIKGTFLAVGKMNQPENISEKDIFPLKDRHIHTYIFTLSFSVYSLSPKPYTTNECCSTRPPPANIHVPIRKSYIPEGIIMSTELKP